jgi:hypothetical protein
MMLVILTVALSMLVILAVAGLSFLVGRHTGRKEHGVYL